MTVSNELLRAFGNEAKPLKSSAVTVSVDVRPSELVTKLSRVILEELIRLANHGLLDVVNEVGEEGILKYLKTLLYLRVLHVNGELKGKMSAYNKVTNYLVVPTFFYQLIFEIGEVRDDDYNIVFKPAYSISSEDLLALDELTSISDFLRRFPTLSVVTGMPNDKSGSLEFMAMQHVAHEVTSYRKDHPVYGFLAAFFEQQEFNEVTGTLHRIHYGSMEDYSLMMTTIMSRLTGGS